MSNINLIIFILLLPFSPNVIETYTGNIIEFEYGSDILTQESKVTLDSIVSWLNKNPKEHSI